jgi:hypothetical protein
MKPQSLNDDTIATLKHQHGEIHRISHPDDDELFVVVRTPPKSDYDRFVSEAGDDRRQVRDRSLSGFLRRNTVYPDRETFDEMLEHRPGLQETFGNKLTEIAGLATRARSEKL